MAKIDLGTDDRLRVADRLGLDRAILEHRFDDEVAAGEVVVVGARLDARQQRVAVGGLGAALGDLIADELLRMGLALVGRFLVAVDQHDVEPGAGADIGDAGAHEAGAEDADLAQSRRGDVGGTPRALVELAHREEQRADHRRRLLRQHHLGEVARLDRQAEVDRQLQPFVDALQDRLGGRIIVVGLAAVDRIGGRPDRHAGGREDAAARQLELRIVPRRLGVRIGLHPVLGALRRSRRPARRRARAPSPWRRPAGSGRP